MQHYYVDNSVASAGDGSASSPFKTLSDFFALTSVTHPITLHLKRGQVHTGGVTDSNALFFNSTGDMSYITPYGIGGKPVIAAEDSGSCFVIGKARKLTMDNIVSLGSMVNNALASVSPCGLGTDYAADVWLNDMEFHAVGGRQQDWKPALWFSAAGDVQNTGHFGMNNPKFVNTSRGVWLLGLSTVPSGSTDNNGDRYYGYGIRVVNPVFMDVAGDGVIISNAASKLYPAQVDADTFLADADSSALVNPSYGSYRTDLIGKASVNFWLSGCNKVAFYRSKTQASIGGQYGIDKESVDFDILCHDCLIDGAYSCNASGLLITSNYASQVQARPSGTSEFDWYYTAGYGNKNNTIRNSVSYNDGTASGRGKVLLQGYTYNLRLENVLFIDTVSPTVNLLLMFGDNSKMWSLTNGIYAAVLDGCTVYAPNAGTINVLHSGSNTGAADILSTVNCNVYGDSNTTVNYPIGGNQSGNTSNPVALPNLPTAAPSPEYARKLWEAIYGG